MPNTSGTSNAFRFAGAIAAVIVFDAGCSNDCCVERHASYSLAGDTPAGAASCPAMIFEVSEDKSVSCAQGCSYSETNPGNVVLEKAFPGSAAWSMVVPVTFAAAEPPSLDVYAYCDVNQNGHLDAGDTCIGSTSVSAGDHQGVTLSRASCPPRL